MIAGFDYNNRLELEQLRQQRKICIVCSKCKQTARTLFYQKRINGQKYHVTTVIGFCEECNRYEIPKEYQNV